MHHIHAVKHAVHGFFPSQCALPFVLELRASQFCLPLMTMSKHHM